MDIEAIILDENATKLGGVVTWTHAKICADLFKKNADRIDGIFVSLPNFGDEKGVADTVKLSGLNAPRFSFSCSMEVAPITYLL